MAHWSAQLTKGLRINSKSMQVNLIKTLGCALISKPETTGTVGVGCAARRGNSIPSYLRQVEPRLWNKQIESLSMRCEPTLKLVQIKKGRPRNWRQKTSNEVMHSSFHSALEIQQIQKNWPMKMKWAATFALSTQGFSRIMISTVSATVSDESSIC